MSSNRPVQDVSSMTPRAVTSGQCNETVLQLCQSLSP